MSENQWIYSSSLHSSCHLLNFNYLRGGGSNTRLGVKIETILPYYMALPVIIEEESMYVVYYSLKLGGGGGGCPPPPPSNVQVGGALIIQNLDYCIEIPPTFSFNYSKCYNSDQ